MSSAVHGRLEQRRCKRAASRPFRILSSLVGVAISLTTAGLATERVLARSSGPDVDSSAVSSLDGFDLAQRISPSTQTASPIPPTPPTTTAPTIPSAQAILDLTNSERASRGLAPLRRHALLDLAAETHAADQFHRGCRNLSHTGTDGSSSFDRIDRVGYAYSRAAENIACGQSDAQGAMSAWMASWGHLANILNPAYTHIGISASRDADGSVYWVQVFATPR